MANSKETDKALDPEVSNINGEENSGEIVYESIFGSNAPPRILGVLDIVSAGFNICNAWSGVAATLFLGFLSCGSVTIIWGLVLATFTVGCCALSLAELSARYPTSGGQYHWTHIIGPASMKRGASYAARMINIFSWLAITALVCVILPQLVLGMAMRWDPSYTPQEYQYFLIYQVSNLVILANNMAILRHALWTHTAGMFFSLLCFFTFFVACLAKASPKAPSDQVWAAFVKQLERMTSAK